MCPDASVSLGLQLSAVAGRNVFYLFFFLGGGQLGRAKTRGSKEETPEIF